MNVPPIALIPLRKGSVKLPGKNVRLLAGKPLFEYAIDQARSAGIASIVISTDIDSILSTDLGKDVSVVLRPAALASSTTSIAEVLRHVLTYDIVKGATIVLLQATSPLRDPADIRRAVNLFASNNYDLVLSATRAESSVLKFGTLNGALFSPISKPEYCFTNRAELPPVYRPDGAVYVFDADWFRQSGSLAGERIGMIEIPLERAYDIDTIEDFQAVEDLLARKAG